MIKRMNQSLYVFGPDEILNWEIDTGPGGAGTALATPNTLASTTVSADGITLGANADGAQLNAGAAKIRDIKVGDIISTVRLKGWPDRLNQDPPHYVRTDLITDIRGLADGKVTMNSQVYLFF